MRLVPFIAVANAALAVLSALLGAAPFTPAIVLFLAYTPLAAIFARQNQTVAALVVVGAAVVAWFLSPLEFSTSQIAAPLFWLRWVALWSAAVIYASRRRLQAIIAAARRGGTHGA
jgi:hypothetical protein